MTPEELLNPTKALIFRITHVKNVRWILSHGVCAQDFGERDPGFVRIGNEDLIAKRTSCSVTCGPRGTLSQYVPFYFTPYSPMLLNIKTGYNGVRQFPMEEIAIIVSSLGRLATDNVRFVFTDSHAYLRTARFFDDLKFLDQIDWKLLQSRDFRRDPERPDRFDRYQAEALVHMRLPVSSILGVVTKRENEARTLAAECAPCDGHPSVMVRARAGWFF